MNSLKMNKRVLVRDGFNADDNIYYRSIKKLRKTIPEWEFDIFFNNIDDMGIRDKDQDNDQVLLTRQQNWIRLEILGEPQCKLYSWAIPDERSLNILSRFGPLIEIGAGKGYWSRLLKDRGVDIIAFDKYVYSDRSLRFDALKHNFEMISLLSHVKLWTNIYKGGPSVLKRTCINKYKNVGRNLFLCYPDEGEEMSALCLNFFQGDVIIHVGELISTGTLSGYPQAPFGRTTSSEFNVLLCESFHCILSASIPRFPFSNDCITVWKRTKMVEGRYDNNSDDKNYWADIPKNERLSNDIAAPCCSELL